MKKVIFVVLLVLVGAGAYCAWRMVKGDGCCGWGGEKTDPWSSYTPPTPEADAGAATPPSGDGAAV